MLTYPQRPSHFAHKAVRMAMKACMSTTHGPLAFAIFVCIAHTEDAKRYRGPVDFYDGQLAPVAGATTLRQLALAREKLVKAGWLSYFHGRKGSPGRYWVTIPDQFVSEEDSPLDESDVPEWDVTKKTSQPPKGDKDLQTDIPKTRNQNVIRTKTKRDQNVNRTQTERELYIPSPIPIPIPEDDRQTDGDDSGADGEESVAASLTAHQTVVTEFTAATGLRVTLTPKRRKHLTARLKDPFWFANWRKALEAIPGNDFLMGRKGNWRARFNWFVESADAVAKILDGDYEQFPDKPKAGARSNGIKSFPGDVYDPSDTTGITSAALQPY